MINSATLPRRKAVRSRASRTVAKRLSFAIETLESRQLLSAAIFSVTESADPGEIINIRGWDFGEAPQVLVSRVHTATVDPTDDEVSVQILTMSDGNLTAIIPDSFDPGLYQIRVHNTDDNSFSDSNWVNKPYAHTTEFTSVGTGHTFRLFGTNLATIEDKTTVTFNNISQSQSPIDVVITTGLDENHVTVTTPSGLIAGDTYELVVNNGFGGAWGDSAALETIDAQSSTADPLDLDVPWGSEFTGIAANTYNVKTDSRLALKAVGDGVANDRAAIQAAIDTANAAGGGVVDFPAGEYLIEYSSGNGLTMKANVVLRGVGMTTPSTNITNSTAILFKPMTGAGTRGLSAQGADRHGIMELTYRNINPTLYADHLMGGASGGSQPTQYVFLKNFKHEAGDYKDRTSILAAKHALVEGSDIQGSFHTSTSQELDINRVTSYLTFRDNTVTWNRARLGYGGRHSVIETSEFYRDADNMVPGSTGDGGWTMGGYSNLIFLNNVFDKIGAGTLTSSNDGETILAEYSSSGTKPAYSSTVTSVNATTGEITDSAASFISNLLASGMGSNAIMIVGGTGAGQWRSITGNTSTTISVDSAWDVQPDATSVYSINRWNTDKWLVKGNQLSNVPRGIWMYTGSYNSVIADNTLTNADGIWIRGNSGYSNRLDIAWDTLVTGNTVHNTNNNLPAHIGAMGSGNSANYRDVLATTGIVFRDNEVQAYALGNNNNSWNNGVNWYEGYGAMANFNGFADDTQQLVGVIFQNNHAINTEREYRTGTSSSQVVIYDPTSSNTGGRLADYTTHDQTTFGDQVIIGFSDAPNPPDIYTPPPRVFTQNNDLAGTVPIGGGVALVTDGTSVQGYDLDAGQGNLYTKDNKVEFAHITLEGDFDFSTQVNGYRHSIGADGYAGLMVRPDASDQFAPFAAMYASNTGSFGYRFEYRTASNVYASKVTSAQTMSYPNVWVRLTRVGNLITGYRSTDGSTWTSVGSVTLSVLNTSVQVGLIANSGLYNRRVSANFRNVSINGTNPDPTIVTAAAANPSPVTGTTTALSVVGADDLGEANLTYTWATTGSPPPAVTFSQNGTNASKNTVASFTKAGSYNFQVTVADPLGETTTSSVSVTVNQTLTAIVVSPATPSVAINTTQQLTASPRDQFDDSMSASITWSVSSGSGSVDSAGLYTAPATAGSATVLATSGAIDGSAAITITAPASTFIEAESGTRGGGTTINSDHAGYTGTGFINFQPNNSWVKWSVNAASAGNFELDFRYALAGSSTRTVQIEVNGVVVSGGVAFSATGGWASWSNVLKTVSLNAGANTIRLTSTGQDGGTIDSLLVTPI